MVRPLLIDRRLGGVQRCLHSVKLACTWYRVLKDFYVSHRNHILECIDYCVCVCSVIFQSCINKKWGKWTLRVCCFFYQLLLKSNQPKSLSTSQPHVSSSQPQSAPKSVLSIYIYTYTYIHIETFRDFNCLYRMSNSSTFSTFPTFNFSRFQHFQLVNI